jgi:ABC-2 type transport system ATP-binding protein
LAENSCDALKPIVEVTNASVSFTVRNGASSSLKQSVIHAIKGQSQDIEVKALQDISLEVAAGEITAIIGRNGAGKSTLLKLLAKVLPPTTGRVIVRGNVSPMIELGAGFSPELSGWENVILYGTLLGRKPSEMEARCSAIAEWAGLEEAIRLPLRTYSSGMVARLAFSIATDSFSELILIDEVLSVGDSEFQARSKERMDQLLSSGATVVLVSHDLNAVKAIAKNVLWIDHGRTVKYGAPSQVIDEYLKA